MIKMVNQRLRERPSGLRDFFDVARHGSPRCSLGFQQAACFQLGERALHGVGVDLRLRGEVAYAGDFFARRVFADDDGQLQLFDELDGAVLSYQERLLKPDPKMFSLLLSRYQLDADACLFLDDAQDNIRAALDAGMNAILVDDPHAAIMKARKLLC